MTLVAVFAVSIVSASPAAAAPTHHVTLSNFTYCVEGDCNNQTLTISPGDTVVWTYADSACDLAPVSCPGHTASSTGGPGAFSSPRLHTPGVLSGNTPTTYSLSFSSPGTYTYTCAFNGSGASGGLQHMDGAIVVQAAAPQGTVGTLLVAPTRPGGGTAAAGAPYDVPIGTSNSVAADELPNTFLPGLPASGRTPSTPGWILPALAAALLTVPAAFVIHRLTSRGRRPQTARR